MEYCKSGRAYQITIELDNDAFDPYDPCPEIVRILKEQVMPALEEGELAECLRLKDYNGNLVGYASLKD